MVYDVKWIQRYSFKRLCSAPKSPAPKSPAPKSPEGDFLCERQLDHLNCR